MIKIGSFFRRVIQSIKGGGVVFKTQCSYRLLRTEPDNGQKLFHKYKTFESERAYPGMTIGWQMSPPVFI